MYNTIRQVPSYLHIYLLDPPPPIALNRIGLLTAHVDGLSSINTVYSFNTHPLCRISADPLYPHTKTLFTFLDHSPSLAWFVVRLAPPLPPRLTGTMAHIAACMVDSDGESGCFRSYIANAFSAQTSTDSVINDFTSPGASVSDAIDYYYFLPTNP